MTDKTKPYFPLGGGPADQPDRATATCFCGAVQLEFPTSGPNLSTSFVCNCTDCRKVTATMNATNFTVLDPGLAYTRGKDKITRYSTNKTVESGNTMTNEFCSVCGTLMNRVSSGGGNFLRIGTVDDFSLHEKLLKPQIEQFTKDRVGWVQGAEGVEQYEGNYFLDQKRKEKA